MSQSKTPLKVLRVGLKRIKRGWTKSSFHRYANKAFVCIEGALTSGHPLSDSMCTPAQARAATLINRAIAEYVVRPENSKRFAGFIKEMKIRNKVNENWSGPDMTNHIVSFNDFIGTKKRDVIAVFEMAILTAEMEEGADSVNKTKTPAFEWTMPQPGIVTVPDAVVNPSGEILV